MHPAIYKLMNLAKPGLLILAFISAVLNFAGFDQSAINADWWQRSLFALTALGVWISLYLFWVFAFSIVPDLKRPGKRISSWLTIVVGCVFIIALSAYWNVTALVGNSVQNLSLRDTGIRAQSVISQAIDQSSGYLSLVPQVTGLSTHTESLALSEEQSGALTGSKGKGGVSKTLRQIKSKVDSLAGAIAQSTAGITKLKTKGQKCLVDLRSAINGKGSAITRGDRVATGVDCINEVVAGLGNQNVTLQIAQGMGGLTAGVVLPVSLKTKKQKQAVQNILGGLQKQADSIADAARAVIVSPVTPLVHERPNAVMGILIYWRSIIPAISTAIAIDLLPLLLLILTVLFYRDREEQKVPLQDWTAVELLDALGQFKKLTDGTATNVPQALSAVPEIKQITFKSTGDNSDWWTLPEDESKQANHHGDQS